MHLGWVEFPSSPPITKENIMKMVKIVFVEEVSGEYEVLAAIARDLTNWEEVADADCEFLKKNKKYKLTTSCAISHIRIVGILERNEET